MEMKRTLKVLFICNYTSFMVVNDRNRYKLQPVLHQIGVVCSWVWVINDQATTIDTLVIFTKLIFPISSTPSDKRGYLNWVSQVIHIIAEN